MSASRKAGKPHVLFYFIPGNPGYLDYYSQDYFAALRQRLDWADGHIHIAGRDLAGFRDDDHAPFSRANRPYVVEDQIRLVSQHLSSLRRGPDGPVALATSSSAAAEQYDEYDLIILAGHSLGAYVALEIFHRHLRDPSASASASPSPRPNLQAGILLFPAVTNIAQSESGRKLSALPRLPFLVVYAAYLVVKVLLCLLPTWFLRAWVSGVMGFSPVATRVTVDFLRRRDAIWQALHMGVDELRTIGEEKWDEALWDMSEAAVTKGKTAAAPRFFFLFGQDDHWVSDEHRAKFMRARERHIANGWVRVEVDDSGLPHSFCVTEKNSTAVADKTAQWLREIWDSKAQ